MALDQWSSVILVEYVERTSGLGSWERIQSHRAGADFEDGISDLSKRCTVYSAQYFVTNSSVMKGITCSWCNTTKLRILTRALRSTEYRGMM